MKTKSATALECIGLHRRIGAAVVYLMLASVVGAAGPLSSRGVRSLDGLVRGVQDSIYRLDMARAEELSRKTIETYPDSPVGYGLVSLVKWNQLLNAAGNLAMDDYATPTPFTRQRTYKPIAAETAAFRQANDQLLQKSAEILDADPNNVTALYFQGVAYENLATEALAILKETGRGITFGKKATGVHQSVLKLDPKFVDAKLSIATREFASATLPWRLKWLAFLLGYRGNREEALAKLEEVSERGWFRRLDAKVVLALLNAWKGDPNVATRIFRELAETYPENYLLDINLAAVYEEHLDDRKRALNVYQDLLLNLPKKAPGIEVGEVHFRIGRTYFELREYSSALEAFNRVFASPVRERETVALSHYYSALIHDLQGDKDKARFHYSEVLEYKGPSAVLREEIETSRKRSRNP